MCRLGQIDKLRNDFNNNSVNAAAEFHSHRCALHSALLSLGKTCLGICCWYDHNVRHASNVFPPLLTRPPSVNVVSMLVCVTWCCRYFDKGDLDWNCQIYSRWIKGGFTTFSKHHLHAHMYFETGFACCNSWSYYEIPSLWASHVSDGGQNPLPSC